MIRNVYGGHGIVGNDVFGIWDPLYDHGLAQREQNIAEAKSLLKSAGQQNLSIELVTAPILAGAVEQAEVFAQQAASAGIKVTVRQVTSTELYGPNYLKWTFSQDYLYYSPYFANVLLCTLPDSALPETHFDNPEYISLYSQAEATTNVESQRTIAHQMQQIDYDDGGYIIACFPPTLDARREPGRRRRSVADRCAFQQLRLQDALAQLSRLVAGETGGQRFHSRVRRNSGQDHGRSGDRRRDT